MNLMWLAVIIPGYAAGMFASAWLCLAWIDEREDSDYDMAAMVSALWPAAAVLLIIFAAIAGLGMAVNYYRDVIERVGTPASVRRDRRLAALSARIDELHDELGMEVEHDQ